MVSDSELIERLRDFLSTSDLNTTTTAIIRRRLEADFGIDLSDRKAFIREQVDAYMQSQFENAAENGEEIDEQGAPEEEEEEHEEEREESSNASTVKSTAKKRSRTKEVVKKRGGGGFTKLCSLSPELQQFTGVPELARTEVVKQLWAHIRENNLQDPSNKRSIICDDILRNLFGVDTIDMFQMNKALTKHIWPLDSDGASVDSTPTPKVKQKKQEKDEDKDEPKRKGKRQRGGNSAFLAPIKLSDALVKFLGTGESALPRSDVIKKIWDYIKLHNLQDPSDKRQILCDEKLKELFNLDTFCGFTVSKLLTVHFIKTEQ
ncbi:SWIB complex BAF60b domain-containing protein [Perilla frutescens var. hirtella]|uniref:SWIB complex BAF60b domain-containing protein n=1 Tax=Perilla frutescens var. hirtella TaxID=608512 RepID=A0AAD4P3E9_PERFH|nr:SWIB complex BAF60b domain-containing protein [Perilla frutescens var. hirtella]KAH6825473.1 SWIB complex BAF60b domain-containing protein [Perilla frutescens var. hirtella]